MAGICCGGEEGSRALISRTPVTRAGAGAGAGLLRSATPTRGLALAGRGDADTHIRV